MSIQVCRTDQKYKQFVKAYFYELFFFRIYGILFLNNKIGNGNSYQYLIL